MNIASKIKNRLKRKRPPPPVLDYKKSYSQCGEDMIIDFVFGQLKMQKFTYLDVGCHHPTYLSNTAFFYEKGHRGACVEPDPFLFKAIKEVRKEDICLNVGVGIDDNKEADFYILSERTLNTFSKEEAERYQSYGNKRIENVMKVSLLNINSVMGQYLSPYPNFVSLDIEGMDLAILKTFDFKKFRPEVFCIETITYTENGTEEKIIPVIKYMEQQGYFVYADTYINSIFVDKEKWKNR
jgi:FkbM family methyltransferase